MRVIVAGGRGFDDYTLLSEELDCLYGKLASQMIVVSGGAKGADKLGERYAEENSLTVNKFPADWDKYGKSAGYRRNAEMATHSEVLIAFWDGKSKGTSHMIDLAIAKGLLVTIVRY